MKILSYHPYDNKKYETIHIKRQWWDSLYQKMLYFESSHLDFQYEQEKYVKTSNGNIPVDEATEDEKNKYGISSIYRMVPVEKNYKTVVNKKEINRSKCEQAFREYLKYNDVDNLNIIYKSDNCVLFDIDEDNIDDFSYFLDRSGIRFEIIKD